MGFNRELMNGEVYVWQPLPVKHLHLHLNNSNGATSLSTASNNYD